MRWRSRYLFGLLVVVAALMPSPVSAAGSPTPFASGFDNPRGIAYVHGRLLVAEAGHGGDVCNAGPPMQCIGRTSQISSLDPATGAHHPLVSHLFSTNEFLGGPPSTLGMAGLSAGDGRTLGVFGVYPQNYASWTCAGQPPDCAAVLAAARREAGRLISVSTGGSWHAIASVGAYDFIKTHGVSGQELDANPYGVLAVDGGAYVADAGSNTLEFVRSGGRITTVVRFAKDPDPTVVFPTDAVPTCVARTEDALWVADLSGRLFRMHGGAATQVSLPPAAQHITGCTAGQDGNLYLVNMWTGPGFPSPGTGNVTKYNPETGTTTLVASGLNFPNMITIGPGALYVTANSVCPASACGVGGTVLRIPLPGEDESSGDGASGS